MFKVKDGLRVGATHVIDSAGNLLTLAANASLLNGRTESFFTNATNISSGTLAVARLPALTGGDATTTIGSGTITLATVNSNVGSFGSAAAVPIITVNAKGLVTAVSTAALGTAATRNTGTSGATVPLLDGTNTWSAVNTFSSTITGSISGNAGTATTLQTARTIAISGPITGTATSFNGSANITIPVTALDVGHANVTGTLGAARLPAFTGDVTTTAGTTATTLATVNSNVGSFGSAAAVPIITVNAKGLVTAVSTQTITPAWSSITSKPTTVSGFGITDAVTTAGEQAIGGHKTFTGNVTVNGDLFVGGTTFTINATNLEITDAIIALARNNSSAAIPFAGIKVERGATDAYLLWDESTDHFIFQTATSDEQAGAVSVPVRASRFISDVATGAAPLTVTSTTMVSNLNVERLAGQNGAFYQNATNLNAGTLTAARLPAFTGDATSTVGTSALTLATVNSNIGSFGSAAAVPVITVNAKGLVTAVSTAALGSAATQDSTFFTNATNISSGTLAVARLPALTGGDATTTAGSGAITLATVNSNVGSFGSATLIPIITVNAKGLVTAVTTTSVNGLTDGNKGDITVTGTGATWTINNNAVSLAKMAQVATATFLGRTTAATGNVEALTATQATALLNEATIALKGLLSSADKSKIDALGTASTQNTGTSGATVPLLNGTNTWSAVNTFSSTITGSISGNAGTATTLQNARTIGISGPITGTATSFNGSANITIPVTALDVGHANVTGTLAVLRGGTGTTTSTGTGSVVLSASPTFTGTINAAAATLTGNITAANFTGSSSGTNTGDQTITLTGDVAGTGTGSFATTLATVNSNVGSFGSTAAVPIITVNAKGLVTAVSAAALGTAATQDATFFTNATNISSGTLATARLPALTGGDATTTAGSGAITLATVNSNVGSFGSAAAVPVITVNAKGLVTAVSTAALGTAATANTGTSGGVVPFLNGNNTWSGTNSFSSTVTTAVPTTGGAGFNLPHGAAPTTPINGDIWTTTASVFARINGATRTVAFIDSNITGSAATLTTGRTIAMTGDVAWTSASFNGSANVTGVSTLATVNSNTGSFGSGTTIPVITVNSKGLITAVTTQAISPQWSSIQFTPTTLGGYGIVDAVTTNTNQTITGIKTFSAAIVGNLTGNADTATILSQARAINNVSFNGSDDIFIPRLNGANGQPTIETIGVPSAVNYLTVQNASMGGDVVISTAGSSNDVPLLIATKGAGAITLDSGAGAIDIKPGTTNLRIWDDDGSHYHRVVVGNISANYNLTLPAGSVTLVAGTMTPNNRTLQIEGTTGEIVSSLTGAQSLAANLSWALSLADTAVTPGTYTAATITVDAKGRVTNASSSSGVVTTSGDQTIGGNKTFSDDVIVQGNLSVMGSTFTVNATNLEVADAIIAVARNNSSASVPFAGLRVERGATDAFIVWDEANDVFSVGTATDEALTGFARVPFRASRFDSNVTTGTAPFIVSSTTMVSNLNVERLDGELGSFYRNAGNLDAGTLLAARLPALSGDAASTAGSNVLTLATVNSNVGSFGGATTAPVITVNGKGLITAVSTQTITPAWSSITSKPTTVSGFGITDAVTTSGNQTIAGTKTFSSTVVVTGGVDITTQFLGNPNDTISAPSFSFTSDTNTGMYRAAAGALAFSTAGTKRVDINSSGLAVVGNLSADNLARWYETRTIPTTVNDCVDIGTFNNINGAYALLIRIVVADSGNSLSKTFIVNSLYGGAAAWQIVAPISDGGPYSGNDFGLEVSQTTSALSARIRRTAGATAGIARISIDSYHSSTTLTPTSDVTVGAAVVTAFFRGTGLTQGINTLTYQGKTVAMTDSNITGSAATLTTGRTIAMTGDVAWTSAAFNGSANVTGVSTLATVNSNVGSFGSAAAVPVITVNAKGLVTAVSTAALGTAATQNTGTSGATIPFLNGNNTWSGTNTFSSTISGNISGSAASLTTARTIGISGPITGTASSFDGTANITIPVTALDIGHANVTGTLAAVRGGTGISSYTANSYVRAASSTTLEQRTPDEVLRDIEGTKTVTSLTPPSNPALGTRWIDTTTGNEFVYYGDVDSAQWVQMGTSGTQNTPFYVQPTPPTAAGAYLWLQTQYGSSDGFTLWFDDGNP
jgi:hypothetical protein